MENKIEEMYLEWVAKGQELREELVKRLHTLLDEHNGFIDISECDTPAYVSYDGGRHPEYDANPFSMVYAVKSKGDNMITFDTQDCDDYEISRVWSVEEIAKVLDCAESVC